MELNVIYPENLKKAVVREDSVFFPEINYTAKISSVLDNRSYKIEYMGHDVGFVYDDRFCAFDFFRENQQLHSNSNPDFYLLPRHYSLYVGAAKNGCSSVVAAIYNKFYATVIDYIIKPEDSVWDYFNSNPQKLAPLVVTSEAYSENKKNNVNYNSIFFVYDDPIDRFVRVLNSKYLTRHSILSFLTPPYDEDIEVFILKLIVMTRLNLLNDKYWEPHIVPISTSHRNVLEQVTDFVNLKDLDKFMKERFSVDMKHYSVSKEHIITKEHLTSKHMDDLNKIYAEDFEIPIKFAQKFYK